MHDKMMQNDLINGSSNNSVSCPFPIPLDKYKMAVLVAMTLRTQHLPLYKRPYI